MIKTLQDLEICSTHTKNEGRQRTCILDDTSHCMIGIVKVVLSRDIYSMTSGLQGDSECTWIYIIYEKFTYPIKKPSDRIDKASHIKKTQLDAFSPSCLIIQDKRCQSAKSESSYLFLYMSAILWTLT